METNNIPPAIKQEIGIQAVEKQQDQILPKTGDVPPPIPTPQQIPPLPSTTIPQQNSKDKMLWFKDKNENNDKNLKETIPTKIK